MNHRKHEDLAKIIKNFMERIDNIEKEIKEIYRDINFIIDVMPNRDIIKRTLEFAIGR